MLISAFGFELMNQNMMNSWHLPQYVDEYVDPICPLTGNVSSLGVESRVVLASSGIGCVVNNTTPRMIAIGQFLHLKMMQK